MPKILSLPAGGLGKTYLYKDGTQYVQFDNGTHNVSTQYKSLQGGATFTATEIVLPQPTVQNNCRTITTTNAIDLTPYTTLQVKTTQFGTLALDVTSVNQSAYICISSTTWTFANNSNYTICASNAKDNFSTTGIALALLDSGSVLTDSSLTITEISLS